MANLNDKDVLWDDDVTWEDETPPAAPNPFRDNLVQKLGHDPFAQLGDAPPPSPVLGGRVPPPREQALMAAMAGGTALTGNPAGGAGAYALADQLLKKYIDGQEITPMGAGESLGKGALYELPALLGGAYAQSNIGKWLYGKGINFPSSTKEPVQKRVTNYGYDNELVANAKTVDKLMSKVSDWKRELTSEIEKAGQAGVTVNPEQIIERTRKRLLDELDGVPFTKTQRARINKQIDDEVDFLRDKFGLGLAGNQSGDVSVVVGQQLKEKGQKYARRQIERARKVNAAVESPTQLHMIAAASDEYKKELAGKVAAAVPLNKKMSQALEWRDFAGDRLRKHGTRTAISHDVTLPMMIELSTRGSLGVPTALGGLRYLSTHPTAMTRAGLLSKYLQKGAEATPPGWMVQGIMDRYNRDEGGR